MVNIVNSDIVAVLHFESNFVCKLVKLIESNE